MRELIARLAVCLALAAVAGSNVAYSADTAPRSGPLRSNRILQFDPIFSDGFELGNICAWSDSGGWPNTRTIYIDLDGDTYGDTNVFRSWPAECAPPSGWTDVSGDCDDTNPAVHPGAPDICNGIDDDCDMVTDEDAFCDDQNQCTADSCGGAAGCLFTPMPGAACEDGNLCTVGDTCDSGGLCVAGAPVVCPPGQSCDPQTGMCV